VGSSKGVVHLSLPFFTFNFSILCYSNQHITRRSNGQKTVGFCSCLAILTNYFLPLNSGVSYTRKFCIKLLAFLLLISPVFVYAGKVYDQFPDKVDPSGKYVFYSHGKIVEGKNTNPVSPRWGEYKFPKVKEALSSNNYTLIAYHRPQNTNPKKFALKLSMDVKKLISLGVKPRNISLVGFSRGGEITILTSRNLQNPDINIILLASCANFMNNNKLFKVYGNIYSIYETSDMVGSCQFLINQSSNVGSFNEISISTGKEHGAFFTPISEWVIPVKKWLGDNV